MSRQAVVVGAISAALVMVSGPIYAQNSRTTRQYTGLQGAPPTIPGHVVVSGNGRYLAFDTLLNLDSATDNNFTRDVYVIDTYTAGRELISVNLSGASGNGVSGTASISDDGRYVVFSSGATDLVGEPDANGTVFDVFVRDRVAHTTLRLSLPTPTNRSFNGVISGNGLVVAFQTTANTLGGTEQILVTSVLGGGLETASVNSSGQVGNGGSFAPVLSGDGRYVAFQTDANNLGCTSPNPLACVPGTIDGNGFTDIYVRDRLSATTSRVSRADDGTESNGPSYSPSISSDGTRVAFASDASNLRCGSVNPVTCSITGRLDNNGVRDIYVRNLLTPSTVRASVGLNGQANGASDFPAISGNGRYVAFQTNASNLLCFAVICVVGTSDTNGVSDVYVRDLTAAVTTRESVGVNGEQGSGASIAPWLDSTGQFVAFSSASQFIPGDTNAGHDVFLRLPRPVVTNISPTAGLTAGGTRVTVTGTDFLPGALVLLGGTQLTNVEFVNATTLRGITAAHAPGSVEALVVNPNSTQTTTSDRYRYFDPPSATADSDGDTIPDDWETRFSLDPLNVNDASQDTDGDGESNLNEYLAGTHPTALPGLTRYLAEGATGQFFDAQLALLNASDTAPAHVVLRFLLPGGAEQTTYVDLPVHTRRTVNIESVAGMASTAFSTIVETDALVVVDRTMSWDASGYGAHLETAVGFPETTWYLAEGATHSNFALFYLLQNPNPTAVTATVRYLRPAGAGVIEKTYPLSPNSRFTIWVNHEDAALASTDVSAKITATAPIIVERAMYKTNPGTPAFNAGHESAGVTATATDWFLAEGATGPYFDLYVLIANPNDQAAAIRAIFLRPDGQTVTRDYTVAANSRFNIAVDQEGPLLADTAVSTAIESLNNVGVIVERAMWWPGDGDTWFEAHNTPAATTLDSEWGLAEGEAGGPRNVETYILLANVKTVPIQVNVKLLFEDGATATRAYTLPPRSRTNVPVGLDFPEAVGRRFGAVVVGDNDFIVERAMYWDANGVHWAAGTNALAARRP